MAQYFSRLAPPGMDPGGIDRGPLILVSPGSPMH